MLKQPGWLRALEIVTGLLATVLGVLVLVFPGWGVATLVLLLSVGLFFIGFRSVIPLGLKGLPNSLKVLSAVTGILSLILGGLVIIFPGLGAATLLILVSFGLIVYGVGRLFLAYTLEKTTGWMRGLMVVVGVVDLILSALVLSLPGLALLTLAVVLSVALLVSGAEAIVSGATGRTWLGDLVEVIKKEIQ